MQFTKLFIRSSTIIKQLFTLFVIPHFIFVFLPYWRANSVRFLYICAHNNDGAFHP